MPPEQLTIRGARQHNLRSVDLDLPKDSLVVLTGVSGSGKSSLAFDTLYAEGQRRYLESLSSYARQFLDRTPKPDVDAVDGLAPAISIEQKGTGHNPRSTVGTVTEIYDYLRVLYAAIGVQHCPACGIPIGAQTLDQIAARLLQLPSGSRLHLLAPVAVGRKGEFRNLFDDMRRAGYVRARVDGAYCELTADLELDRNRRHTVEIVVDRGVIGRPGFSSGDRSRLSEAVENALGLAEGVVLAVSEHEGATEETLLSTRYACERCGVSYSPPTHVLFSFNTLHGMCRTCDGLGTKYDFDADLITEDSSKSLAERAIPLMPHPDSWYRHIYQGLAEHYGFDITTPIADLTRAQHKGLFYGSGAKRIRFTNGRRSYRRRWEGALAVIAARYKRVTSPNGRKRYESFMRHTHCPDCRGGRLNPQALSVLVGGKSIAEVCAMSIADTQRFFEQLTLSPQQALIAEDALKEIRGRLGFLMDVGLHYLTLDRTAPTLSGGESQRIRLAGQVGSGLVGVLYVLDEPSIGLHNRDNARLLRTLQNLRDRGNTVVVVEHDEDTMMAADHIVDFGPGAGEHGGEAVVSGPLSSVLRSPRSLTGKYLRGELEIPIPDRRRPANGKRLTVRGARQNNLKDIDVAFPLGEFICVTGVSGSGKSSLVNDILYRVLARELNRAETEPGAYRAIEGMEHLDKVIDIDQSPIGRTPRSNPATYTGVFDHIRQLFASLPDSRARGYKQGRFSFNVKGGRCEACEGNGAIRLEMDFLADTWVTCEMCGGTRFNNETLEIAYKGRSIAQVLDMDVAAALQHFAHQPRIAHMLSMLHDVGMDYVRLGQPAPTLSGGEAQRVKLATELCRKSTGKTLYILDEPTTGLHFADIQRLLDVLHRFVDLGNTVVVVEHNLEVIKTADHIIDLGPEGGAGGGAVVATGTPEEVAANASSYTGQALRALLRTNRGRRAAAVRRAAAASRRRRRRRLEHVQVRGGREHNLRGVDVRIPRERMSVFSGPSGSGKSSLALDTIYAEGQRRYIGSLSSYARQFLGRLDKPAVDLVDGLSPAISIEQRATSHSPRSTVGTVTEIYDYLRALYARLGVQHCPDCGVPVGAQASSQIIDRVAADFNGCTVALLAPVTLKDNEEYADVLNRFAREGYRRVRFDGDIVELESVGGLDRRRRHSLELVVDRVKVSARNRERLADSTEQALQRSGGWLVVSDFHSDAERRYSRFLSCPSCWKTFEPIVPKALSFNHIQGWCPACEGIGTQRGADLEVVVSKPRLSIRNGAVGIWGALCGGTPLARMVETLAQHIDGLDLDTPWCDLPAQARQSMLYGTGQQWFDARGYRFAFRGLIPTIEEAARMSGRVRRQVEHVVRDVPCTVCHGGRLNPVSSAVKLRELSLPALCELPLEQAQVFLEELCPDDREVTLAGEMLAEIRRRLRFLVDVGLEYVTLGRAAATLSGGESQRIRLAAQIGSGLTGVLYVLDEPTIGLHPRDNARLLKALRELRDLGNTLIVVEHDRDTLEAADHLVDFGPGAGPHGGSIVATGAPSGVMRRRKSLTGQYLAGRLAIPVLRRRRPPVSEPPGPAARPDVNYPGWLTVVGAQEHNLRDITVQIPLGVFVAVTGPSGSGKSTLINEILHNYLARELNGAQTAPGRHERILGAGQLGKVIAIDQTPLGHGARSDPSTYTGVFERIRELYAMLPEARVRGYNKRRFSYNHKGGRCEACWGLGQRRIEMHFLPDVWVDCDVCHGARFNRETLEVKYRGKSIADVLAMPIESAYRLFARQPRIERILGELIDVGLGYMQLGQPASTLSGGEAQRVKLARELARPGLGRTIYLLDEPTTGLHVSDVQRLLAVLHRLVEAGNTVLVIEHNMEVVKSADWVIDLGPGGGEHGGTVVAAGPPEQVVCCSRSSTGPFLREALERSPRIERDALVETTTRPRVREMADDAVDAATRPEWISDGVRWHTKTRVDDDGLSPKWDGDVLLSLVREVEKLHPRMRTDWNRRNAVISSPAGRPMSFMIARTAEMLYWLELRLQVKAGDFTHEQVRELCPLPVWDDVEDMPIFGKQPRIMVDLFGGGWDVVVVDLWSRDDIEDPGFRQLLKRCFASYIEACRAERRRKKEAANG